MIGLLDANNFFVPCERVFYPDLLKRPVAVLSNNLDDHQAAVFSPNFSLYGVMSARMMNLIESLVPRMEVYSIDEAFIDFSSVAHVEEVTHHIRNRIWQSLGIQTSIGIAETKTLSKVVNHFGG